MIRKAMVNDSGMIHDLCVNDLGYECDGELVRKRLEGLDPERECVFVAVADDRIAGFIHVEKYEVLYCQGMANILGLAVAKNYRRQGIGGKLLTEAAKWAASMGLPMVRLNSGMTRKEAHTFYRNMGYDNEKEQMRFLKTLKAGE